jgi:PTH1 family peptidyl-tRNA hydrolase
MSGTPFLIIGLGNPGREYKDNRHNVGFMLIDRLAVRLDARMNRLQSKALVSSVLIDEHKTILAKPQTYMNLSGDSVGGLARFYKVPLEQVLVAHDDLDLPFGTIRVRPGGGPGGQKGVASAIQRLGSKDFPRLRIGIGRPPGRMDPAKFVLQDFPSSEQFTLSEVLDRAAEAVLSFVQDGVQAAMNKFNASSKSSD